MLRRTISARSQPCRHLSVGLPYRIRVPLKKLQEKKNLPQPSFRPAALGDGEQLESNSTEPDYMRLALTSRVYDMVVESPMQHCSGLSQRLGVRASCMHSVNSDSH
eukprot:3885936-Pleurochrysis_carterae.AAC.1